MLSVGLSRVILMVKQRVAYERIVLEPAKTRIANGECPVCSKPKDKWTRSTRWYCCCHDCTVEFNEKYVVLGWPDLRNRAFRRDNYTCVKCGAKPTKEYLEEAYPDFSKLIGDHIIPISLGGDQWDIDNVQTLCIQCNKIKTKQDQGLIASARHRERQILKGQKTLWDFI